MEIFLSLCLGYALGCLNPAAWVGKRHHVDMKHAGTGNLGATNTTMVLGRKAGVFVLCFDVLKTLISARLARILFPQLAVAGMIACIGTILGHCFPVTMHFDGGKGLAAFGGMILAYNPVMFVLIVVTAVAVMVILDIGVAAPLTGTVLFPVLTFLYSRELPSTGCALVASLIIVYTHLENLRLTREQNDIKVHSYFKNILFKKK